MSLPRPQGLLLDFGGVVFETSKRPSGITDLAEHVRQLLRRAGYECSTEQLARSLRAGQDALKHWKHAASRRNLPREMSHREVVGDFLAADLPDGPRQLLVAEASALLETVSTTISDHHVRPGIPELLAYCRAEEIPVGIVSNAHSGRAHRRLLAASGLAEHFAVQVYSDEVGLRKPHPGMIQLAAEALGLAPHQTWYVGDTQDRDVAAGRRAGVGGILVARSKHTDNPPFAVAHTADATLDDPRGVLELLRAAPHQPPATAPEGHHPTRGALFIDHGGVISTSVPTPERIAELAAEISQRLTVLPGPTPSSEDVVAAIAVAREHQKRRKDVGIRQHRNSGQPLLEITPAEFWGVVSERLGGHGAWFRAEAADLMHRYAVAKSARTLRPGIPELLTACRAAGMPVVVVSNTISGRTVRGECHRHGLTDLISAFVCSDELGRRKPDPDVFTEALTVADATPELSWFIGDKPLNDAAGARSAGIAHGVLISGGATPDDELAAALAAGDATAVITSPTELIGAISAPMAS